MAFPEERADELAKIYESVQPHVPDFYLYEYHSNFVPAEIAANLEVQARAALKKYVSLP